MSVFCPRLCSGSGTPQNIGNSRAMRILRVPFEPHTLGAVRFGFQPWNNCGTLLFEYPTQDDMVMATSPTSGLSGLSGFPCDRNGDIEFGYIWFWETNGRTWSIVRLRNYVRVHAFCVCVAPINVAVCERPLNMIIYVVHVSRSQSVRRFAYAHAGARD